VFLDIVKEIEVLKENERTEAILFQSLLITAILFFMFLCFQNVRCNAVLISILAILSYFCFQIGVLSNADEIFTGRAVLNTGSSFVVLAIGLQVC
jgi:hypothetical protein